MPIQRVSIRSPLQSADLKPAARPSQPQAPAQPISLTAFADVSKLVDELTKLRDLYLDHAEKATDFISHVSQMQKGEQGEQGEKGESAFTEEELKPYIEYMIQVVTRNIALPKNGKDGQDGIDGVTPVLGVTYFHEGHKKEIVSRVLQNIRQPRDGETPVVDHDQLASAVIAKILDGKLLKKEHVDGLTQEIASYRAQFANGKGYVHGGGDTVKAGTNVTITRNNDGTTSINAPGAGGLGFLVATGVVDNVNTTFTFASQPTLVIVNGATYRNGHGVTISGDTATLDNPVGNGGDIYGLG